MISITGRLIGIQKPLFEPWSIAIEPYLDGSDEWTLSELIEMVVLEASTIFKEPPHEPTFLRSINAMVVSELAPSPDVTCEEQSPMESEVGEAIGNALQAFEEDVFLVVLDGEDVMHLEDEIDLHPDSQITFVRLVPYLN
jgi:hypothetical protein